MARGKSNYTFTVNANPQAINNLMHNFLKANGYNNVGVYSSVVRLDTSYGNLNDATIRSYPIWVAQYYRKNQYDGEYKIWQFQSDGLVDGINGYVDVNMYKK